LKTIRARDNLAEHLRAIVFRVADDAYSGRLLSGNLAVGFQPILDGGGSVDQLSGAIPAKG
jgi:hypothetical protein